MHSCSHILLYHYLLECLSVFFFLDLALNTLSHTFLVVLLNIVVKMLGIFVINLSHLFYLLPCFKIRLCIHLPLDTLVLIELVHHLVDLFLVLGITSHVSITHLLYIKVLFKSLVVDRLDAHCQILLAAVPQTRH